jgi:hypothetical protein
MLRCASSFVIAAYETVRLIPQDSRALPAAFLRSRPIFATFNTFYEVVISGIHPLRIPARRPSNDRLGENLSDLAAKRQMIYLRCRIDPCACIRFPVSFFGFV